jgi:hypothetical protein
VGCNRELSLIVRFHGLDGVVSGIALIPRACLGRIDAPSDEAEEAEGEVDVGEEGGVDLVRQKTCPQPGGTAPSSRNIQRVCKPLLVLFL